MAFASLTIDLNARLANIESDLGKVAHVAEQQAQRMQSAFSAVGTTLGGLGIGLGVAGLVTTIKEITDQADNINDLATRTQTSVEALSSFKLIAEQSGTSLEALGKGLNKVTLFMAENASEARQLGITATDPVEAFLQLAAALEQAATPQERAAIANKVLGKSYAELLPLLNEGRDNLRTAALASADYAKAMGKLAPEADKFNDALAKLSQAGETLKIDIGNSVISALTDVVKAMAEAAEESGLLKAAWVGLGGLGSQIFNGTEMAQAKTRLSEIESYLPKLRQSLQKGTFTGGETGTAWLDAIIPDVSMNADARSKLEARIRQMEAEAAGLRERINGVSKPNKKAPGNTTLEDIITDEEAAKIQSALRKAFDLKPLDDYISAFQDKAAKISAEYAKLRLELEPQGTGQATGLDVSSTLQRAKSAFSGGDTAQASGLLDRAKSQLRSVGQNGGFEATYLSRELEAFEQSMNAAAEKTAINTRDVLRKNLEAIAVSLDDIKPVHIPLATDAIAADIRATLDTVRAELAADPLLIPATVITDDASNIRRTATKLGSR